MLPGIEDIYGLVIVFFKSLHLRLKFATSIYILNLFQTATLLLKYIELFLKFLDPMSQLGILVDYSH